MHLPLLGVLLPLLLAAPGPLATSPLATSPHLAADPWKEPAPEPETDPHRQFDFWLGEWSVQNRHIDSAGNWNDGDVTRARITPVIGGAAVLEEWAGPFHGAFMNGFSLRAYDPNSQRWSLLLFWTTDGDGSFGQLHGRFRHGRGEFFAPDSGARQTRYSFSDGLPDSVRWDSATTQDSGITWKTDWIMEFSRTRPAAEVTQDELFATDWTQGELSTHPAARKLDWMLGTWLGTQTDEAGTQRAARLQARLLNKDALLLDVLETRAGTEADWTSAVGPDAQSRLFVRGWAAGRQDWEGWSVRSDDTHLHRHTGILGEGGALFDRLEDSGGPAVSETLRHIDEDHLVIEEAVGTGDDRRIVRTTELERVDAR